MELMYAAAAPPTRQHRIGPAICGRFLVELPRALPTPEHTEQHYGVIFQRDPAAPGEINVIHGALLVNRAGARCSETPGTGKEDCRCRFLFLLQMTTSTAAKYIVSFIHLVQIL